jgi:ADP-ribose pyrophosphatase YjhB (NUDIX family)
MSLKNPFKYCPSCQSENHSFDRIKKFICNNCGFEYYHNTASAVAAFLEYNGKVVVIERNRNPGKGMLDLPGGFSDPMESGEESLRREIKEELGIEPNGLTYLCSAPNKYQYKNNEYYTTDFFYTGKINTNNFTLEYEEIRSIKLIEPKDLDPDKFSFQSMKMAISIYQNIIL